MHTHAALGALGKPPKITADSALAEGRTARQRRGSMAEGWEVGKIMTGRTVGKALWYASFGPADEPEGSLRVSSVTVRVDHRTRRCRAALPPAAGRRPRLGSCRLPARVRAEYRTAQEQQYPAILPMV